MNTIKKNLIFSSILLFLGIVFLFIAITGMSGRESLESIFWGYGCGFTAGGLPCVIMGVRALKNPTKAEEIEINESDERNILLREKTSAKVYSIFIYVESVITFFSLLLGYREIALVVSILLLLKLIAWAVIGTMYGKKY